jgi:hypothetical protein
MSDEETLKSASTSRPSVQAKCGTLTSCLYPHIVLDNDGPNHSRYELELFHKHWKAHWFRSKYDTNFVCTRCGGNSGGYS